MSNITGWPETNPLQKPIGSEDFNGDIFALSGKTPYDELKVKLFDRLNPGLVPDPTLANVGDEYLNADGVWRSPPPPTAKVPNKVPRNTGFSETVNDQDFVTNFNGPFTPNDQYVYVDFPCCINIVANHRVFVRLPKPTTYWEKTSLSGQIVTVKLSGNVTGSPASSVVALQLIDGVSSVDIPRASTAKIPTFQFIFVNDTWRKINFISV